MRRALLVISVALVLGVNPARAFELLRVDHNPCSSAQHLFWASRAAAVDVGSLQPVQFQSYALQARDRWNQAVSTFQFKGGHGNFCDPNDGVTSMGFSATVCDGSAFGDAVSVTYFRFNPNTGEMADADITFSNADPDLTDRALFTQIAMHELGHVLGLAHSDACGTSGQGTLMQTVTPLNAPRLDSPQADDIAGARAIYPSGDGTVPAGANSCAISPDASRGSPAGALVIPLLLLLLLRAAARRSTSPHHRPKPR